MHQIDEHCHEQEGIDRVELENAVENVKICQLYFLKVFHSLTSDCGLAIASGKHHCGESHIQSKKLQFPMGKQFDLEELPVVF